MSFRFCYSGGQSTRITVERELVFMPISYRKIAEHIRVARDRSGMTQAAVAEALGISINHYGQLERGKKRATLDMLGQLCELFDVSLDEMLDGALEKGRPTPEAVTNEKQIDYIFSLIKGCSPKIIGIITEVVESITKIDRG
ncbi:MAG: helix-turn-helix domain-containing protein [Aristaeellaceae bacterium]